CRVPLLQPRSCIEANFLLECAPLRLCRNGEPLQSEEPVRSTEIRWNQGREDVATSPSRLLEICLCQSQFDRRMPPTWPRHSPAYQDHCHFYHRSVEECSG